MTETPFDADSLHDALADKLDALSRALQARVVEKLSGEVLARHSGALADSIFASLEDGGTNFTAEIGSSGVVYAAIQEYGGKTAAHDIVAVKAKALAFMTGGALHFARSVHHPGSLIPARSYLGSSLDEMRDDIENGLKDAVLAALGAD